MDSEVKFSTATKIVFSLSVLLVLLALLILPSVEPFYPKYADAFTYSIIASAVGLVICFLAGFALALRDASRSFEIQSQRTQTQSEPERPAETNRSNPIQLQRTQALPAEINRNTRIQPERAGRSGISPDFYGQIARPAVALLQSLPPLESYKCSDKMDGSKSECAICLEEFKIGQLVQPFSRCNHQFHASCINSWVLGGKITCPTCRCFL